MPKEIAVEVRTLSFTLGLLLSVPALCSADPIYKSTMPDGRVIYGEEAFPGAQRVDRLAAPPAKSGVVVATPEDKSRAGRADPSGSAVTIIPAPRHAATEPAVQGRRVNPDRSLPKRSY